MTDTRKETQMADILTGNMSHNQDGIQPVCTDVAVPVVHG